MKTFKSVDDVEAAALPPPLKAVVRRVVQGVVDAYAPYGGYDPDAVGYSILVEEGDTDATIEAEVGYNLREALLESGLHEDGCYLTCTLHNNEYGISWIVPDQPWLDPAIRAKLAAECGEEVPR